MLKIALLLCALGGALAQNNPLIDCQNFVQTYHLMFEGTADNIRTRMSEYTKDLAQDLVTVMVEEFQRWEAMAQRCGPLARNTEAIGETVRACSEVKSGQLSNLQDAIFNDLEAISRLSNELAVMPVSNLVNINIVLEYENFMQQCETFAQDHYNELEEVHIVALNEHINDLLDARDNLPQDLTTCINAAMIKRFPNVRSC